MNLQKIFEAVRNEPDQPTLIVAVTELERQGYKVLINNRYAGSMDLLLAEERDEFKYMPYINGVLITTIKDDESQTFRIHYLDIDAIAITGTSSLPIEYNQTFTTNLFKEQ